MLTTHRNNPRHRLVYHRLSPTDPNPQHPGNRKCVAPESGSPSLTSRTSRRITPPTLPQPRRLHQPQLHRTGVSSISSLVIKPQSLSTPDPSVDFVADFINSTSLSPRMHRQRQIPISTSTTDLDSEFESWP